jgi:hypothetical protein
MGLPVGRGGIAGVGGMLVVCRGIEFFSHVGPPWRDNASAIRTFPAPMHRSGPICRWILLPHERYCTDRRCNFGSTMSAMRSHPHRRGKFAVLQR